MGESISSFDFCLLVFDAHGSERSASFFLDFVVDAIEGVGLLGILNLVTTLQRINELLVATDIQIHSIRLNFAEFRDVYQFEIWSAVVQFVILSIR